MSERYQRLMDQIESAKPVLIDGATGTEVERRGVPKLTHAWNAGGTLSSSTVVQQIHEDYIRCGARIIISNTFATHRSTLEDAGVGDQFEAYNRRAVEIACAARDSLSADNVLVAGGLSHWSFTHRPPTERVLRANATEQARIMADAGAELLLLEMMANIERTRAVLDGALASGLPVWVGYSCKLDEHSQVVLLEGEPLADAIAALEGLDVPLISIMHTDVEIVSQCLDVVDSCWNGPVGVYAHSGEFEDDAGIKFDTVISKEGYCDYVGQWLGKGVNVIGGCCGVGPEHITHLAATHHFSA